MKLLRHGEVGRERPGICLGDGDIRDLSAVIDDVAGENLSQRSLAMLRLVNPDELPRVDEVPRLGAPITRVGKIICVGLNYADHATESGMPVPEQPIIFMKSTTSIIGPYDDVVIPHGSTKTDWEVELGVVIGDVARSVPPEAALDYVAGYLVVNDISERAFQLEHGGQWVKGKSCDTFAPLGPYFVTRDEVPDVQELDMWLEVNDRRLQRGNTRTMVFGVASLVSYISRYMTLMPGDIISTGTPPGVGLGQKPPIYLKPGDVMRLGIQRLGVQRQQVVACA